VHFFGPIGIYTAKGPNYHSVLLTVENENGVNDAVELIVSEEDGVTPIINSNWELFELRWDTFPI
jgi:hypothetical protein